VVLADRVQEQAQLLDVGVVAVAPGPLGMQISQVAFQHGAIHEGETADRRALCCEEDGEPGENVQPCASRAEGLPGGEPPADPPFGEFAKPGLRYPVEAPPSSPRGWARGGSASVPWPAS
jgi:hypothetical protein